jgi:uncharacterized NAD(P)/FAD-binding protein YdhS
MEKEKIIAVIGGGFAGTMLAVNCIKKSTSSEKIFIIDEKGLFGRGVAYSPYSGKQLLNVVASKMSAFADQPDHFLNWLRTREEFNKIDQNLLAHAFLPRRIYGNYLAQLWNETKESLENKTRIQEITDNVVDIEKQNSGYKLILDSGKIIFADICVLATGNSIPRNPKIVNELFFKSKNYFQNPWAEDSVENLRKDEPVLIIGNGLTMVDTVIGLLEKEHTGEIWSVSPNGFNILPHRHAIINYNQLVKELPEKASLKDIASLVIHHIKLVRSFGITAEPVIDFTQATYTKNMAEFFC